MTVKRTQISECSARSVAVLSGASAARPAPGRREARGAMRSDSQFAGDATNSRCSGRRRLRNVRPLWHRARCARIMLPTVVRGMAASTMHVRCAHRCRAAAADEDAPKRSLDGSRSRGAAASRCDQPGRRRSDRLRSGEPYSSGPESSTRARSKSRRPGDLQRGRSERGLGLGIGTRD